MNNPESPVPSPKQNEAALFTAALERPPSERAAFLDSACHGDAALRQRLEALLAAHEATDSLPEPKEPVRTVKLNIPDLPDEVVGQKIGRYKILEKVGEGGCGVVYVAEQTEPVRRRIALKVIKLGMDTKQVVARFEAERQALAMMDHPNIAKVLDAGTTDVGRPYFVMELVRGIRITDYCDQAQLSTEARVDLFIQVCHAIQHAHQKGIIHRDIKPSNILVTLHDGVPVPKVIDFGIAKATEGRLTDNTVYTQLHQFIGTPAYMSPEQAEMSGLDIDTRSDIYSLGVLLYELLAGSTPFDGNELMSLGIDAMRKIIREKEPQRPSTKLATLPGEALTTTAKSRSVDTSKLANLLKGDLDWIVMKCLEKDRSRRYETANGLAADIQRHLSNEPVVARPPSTSYRFQKLVRRNKLAVAATGAVAAALIVGLGISTWMFFKEKEARQRAVAAEREQSRLRSQAEASQKKSETEAAKAIAISDFLQQMMGSANPDALKGSDYTVRQLLDDFSAGLENQLKDQPEVEAAVRATIGRAYRHLGVFDKAQAHHERALTLRRRIFGEQSEPVAESLVDYAWSFCAPGQFEKAEPYVREVLEIYRKRGTVGQPVISALWVLQKIMNVQERYAELEVVTEEALAIAGKSPGVEFPELGSMIHGLAETKIKQSQYVEGESLARKAVEMDRRLRGPEHPQTAWALLALGSALLGQHKLPEAEGALREALTIFRKYYSSGHMSIDYVMGGLKSVLEARGDSAGLETLARQQFADANKRIERNDADPEAWIEMALGHAQLKLWKAAMADCEEAVAQLKDANSTKKASVGARFLSLAQLASADAQHETAERASQQAVSVFKSLVQENPQAVDYRSTLGHSHWELGKALEKENRPEQAEKIYLEALHVFEQAARDFPSDKYFRQEQAFSHRILGGVLNALGRVDDAERHYREGIALYNRLAADVPKNTFYPQDEAYTTWLLAEMLQRASRPAAAIEYQQVITLYQKAVLNFPNDAGFKTSLLNELRTQGKLAEAKTLLLDTLATNRKVLGNEHPEVAATLHKLGDLLRDSGKWTEAEEAFREAVAMRRKLFGNEHLDLGHSLQASAWVLHHNGKRAEAEALSREVLAMRRKLLGNEHWDVAVTLKDLIMFLRDQGKVAEAETKLAEIETLHRGRLVQLKKQFGDVHREVEVALGSLAQVLHEERKLAEAEAVWREELAMEKKLSGNEHPFVANSLDKLGAVLRDSGKWSEAEAVLRESVVLRRKLSADDPQLAIGLATLTSALLAAQKFIEAEPLARECLALREKQIPDDWRTFNARSMLGGSLLGQKKYAEAEPLLLSGYEGMIQREASIPPDGKVRLNEALARLIQLYKATNQPAKAAEWEKKLAETKPGN